ncbi:hypothetical protein D3C76_1687620 [compost metagenome]
MPMPMVSAVFRFAGSVLGSYPVARMRGTHSSAISGECISAGMLAWVIVSGQQVPASAWLYM